MLAGLLDLTCEVQELTATQNALGGMIKSYATRTGLAAAACSFKQIRANEAATYGKANLFAFYRFYIEYNSTTATIDKSDRIVFDSRTFEIKAIYNVAGKNHHFQIDSLEVD